MDRELELPPLWHRAVVFTSENKPVVDLRPKPRCKSTSETKPDLHVDTTIVRRIATAKPTKATTRSGRLSKQTRSQVADRVIEVHMVQDVVEVQ